MRAAEVGPVRPPFMLYTLDVYADVTGSPWQPAVHIRQDDLDGEWIAHHTVTPDQARYLAAQLVMAADLADDGRVTRRQGVRP